MIYPTVGVCWHAGTPEALVDLAVDLMGHGYPTPAFFGDAMIQRGLGALHVPPEEACRYINSTCVEITPSGASNVWVASPYYNTCGLLLEEIAAQAKRQASTFDAFIRAYFHRLTLRSQRVSPSRMRHAAPAPLVCDVRFRVSSRVIVSRAGRTLSQEVRATTGWNARSSAWPTSLIRSSSFVRRSITSSG